MNEEQTKCIEYFEDEAKRYDRMAERCRTIQLPILGYFCQETARRMREVVSMQKDAIKNTGRFLVTDNFTPERK